MEKILLVEDDISLREEQKCFLENNGYEVIVLEDFSNSLSFILQVQAEVSLILMDINIPGLNGEYLCREIRKTSNVPIIMVTSKNNDIDELMSISYGADDYVTKPYNTQILLARMEAVLKRYHPVSATKIAYRDMKLNVSKSVIESKGQEWDLSKNETRILHYLLKNRGKIISREEIMDYLWGSEEFIDDNTLTVNINRLRKKLEDLGYEDVIETKRGQGYLIA